MLTLETFSVYIMLCVLAPLLGAFSLLFLFIFEKRLDQLKKEKNELLLEQELQEAKYNQLNQQIQPHFFFNTLNILLSLARLNRKEELISSIEALSKYFKFKYKKTEPFITINEEVQYTQYYLDIQKLRFRERLEIIWNIDEGVLNALVPPFLLQTLVENSFKHGLEKTPGKVRLKIFFKEENDSIHLEVWNSSTSFEDHSLYHGQGEHGLGLLNIRKRLQMLFPQKQTLLQLRHEEHGTSVQTIWPKVCLEGHYSFVKER
ncbi:sensor histidine kinase YesM [Bacillus pakistanensis]|uniref:Sensor histidine kinase YesM n=1 Tax=Rossellomorea pakistanensis TaxID=992288 RepID=A0ABS2NCW8_9BACI|nr:histidine kinase [Bacillus pakistanensis]MBM7585706.1 sensor histidine kinase YesM [Bacillus pakistanensis]